MADDAYMVAEDGREPVVWHIPDGDTGRSLCGVALGAHQRRLYLPNKIDAADEVCSECLTVVRQRKGAG